MPLPLISGSPGVYNYEEDFTGYVAGIPTSIGVIVFGSKKGSLGPKKITSPGIFSTEYGPSDLSWGYGHISSKAFLGQGNQLICLRALGTGVQFAGSSMCYSAAEPLGQHLNVVNYQSNGTATGFDNDPVEIHNTLLSSPLVAGSSISGSISFDNITVNITAIGYSTDQTTTLQAVTAAITAALGNFMSLYEAQVPSAATLGQPSATLIDPSYGIIGIVSPEGILLDIELTVANNNNATTMVAYNSNLFDVFAENPGAWGDNIGWNITNINTGVLQRSNITFSAPLIQGNVIAITMLLNNVPVVVGPYTVPANQSSDQAINNILTLIAQALQSVQSNITTVYPNGFGANFARVISMVSPTPGPNVIGVQSYSITGGNSQAALFFVETMAGIASDNTFVFNVFNRSNLRKPVSSHKVSLTPQLDGLNNQLFMEDVVNVSGNKSRLVRVVVNKALISSGMIIDPALAAQFANITFLAGGNDGALPTNSQLINAWSTFADTEKFKFNIMINAGYTASAVQQYMANLADTRRDCMAIIDVPSDKQATQDCYDWRTQESNINTSFVAIVSPRIKVLDTDSNQQVFVPRSGYDAARYVYTDKTFTVWNAPAGYDRGRLPDALDIEVNYTKPDRDILDPVQINCTKKAQDGSGILIFAENTAQVSPSLLSSIAVRRNLIYIENSISMAVERNMFDLNSQQLGFLLRKRIERFLEPIRVGNGLSKYKVVIDTSNNPGIFADAGQLNISVYMTPIRPVRTILLDSIIVPTGVTFNELIINNVY